MITESLDDLFSVITDTINTYQELKSTKFILSKPEQDYYELFYTVPSTFDDLVATLDIDIKEWDTDVGASDEYVEVFGKDDSKAEKDLLIKLRDNAAELIVYRQLILLTALEDLMKIQ
jgi:hypothetical protein